MQKKIPSNKVISDLLRIISVDTINQSLSCELQNEKSAIDYKLQIQMAKRISVCLLYDSILRGQVHFG